MPEVPLSLRKREKTVHGVTTYYNRYFDTTETIIDPVMRHERYELLIGNRDKSLVGAKPVLHQKMQMRANTPGIVWQYASKDSFLNGQPPEYTFQYTEGGFLWDHIDQAINACRQKMLDIYTSRSPVDWDGVVRAAVPSLRNEFNTINFLLELDDLPKLAGGLRDKYRYLRKKRVGIDTNWTRNSLNTALEVNLGWIPLYSDADTLRKNVQDFWDKTREKARKLENARLNLERGIRCGVELFDIPYKEVIGPLYDVHGREYYLSYDFKLRAHATCVAYGHYGGSNPFAAMLDNMGLYPDLSTIWNAIPFSFVVDYFIPIGKRLEASFGEWDWQTVGLVNALRIRDACVSFKASGIVEIACTGNFAGTPYATYNVSKRNGYLRAEVTSYERNLVTDAVLDGKDVPLQGQRLNAKQETNIAGILLGIFDRPRSSLNRLPSRR